MALLLSQLRARLEALVFDGYGSAGYTIAASTFRRPPPDLDQNEASAERVARVVIGLPTEAEEGVNPLDGHALRYRPIEVRVLYQLTEAGDDVPEGTSALAGPGSVDAVGDRMSHDAHAITTALTWHEHWAGLDPYLVSIVTDGQAESAFEGAIATLSLRFRSLTRETLPGSYGP